MSRRQQIIDAMKTRFSAITTAGGYATNIGNQVHEWRTTEIPADGLPAQSLRDPVDEVTLPDKDSLMHRHHLNVILDLVIQESAEQATEARKALADVVKAIGVDPTWGGLAARTLPRREQIMTDAQGNWLGGARMEFVVEYDTMGWAN
ncbi:MAG TPA: hypothetical protein VF735_06595 [Pyrinomonadaceae bacterium]|jgi:hypothetical protein